MNEVSEPRCKPTLTTTTFARVSPDGTLNAIDVSETHAVARLAVRGKDAAWVDPCVPKKVPIIVAKTDPEAGEFTLSNDETCGRM